MVPLLPLLLLRAKLPRQFLLLLLLEPKLLLPFPLPLLPLLLLLLTGPQLLLQQGYLLLHCKVGRVSKATVLLFCYSNITQILLKNHSKITQKSLILSLFCSGHRLSEGFSFSEDRTESSLSMRMSSVLKLSTLYSVLDC
jgi:hypothetical protein